MKADADAAIEGFGKNEQVKRVFWTLSVVITGLVLLKRHSILDLLVTIFLQK
jgi:hypothetical protein